MKLSYEVKRQFQSLLQMLIEKKATGIFLETLELILDETQEEDAFKGKVEILERLKNNETLEGQYALITLGWLNIFGISFPENKVLGVEYIKSVAEKNNEIAHNCLGCCYQGGIGTPKNDRLAFENFQLAAKQGLTLAQTHLADCYRYGIGTAKNAVLAFENYKLAAQQNLASAQNELGYCYQHGIGTAINEKLAFEYYRLAADQRSLFSQNNLGFCYQHGVGTTKNEKLAFKNYKLAAKQGLAEAQRSLGDFYFFGIGTTKDERLAFENYKSAAEQGNAEAQCNLAECYQEGIGTIKNEFLAFKYYELASKRGEAEAHNSLALCYSRAIGTKRNDKLVFEFSQLAARKMVVNAQHNLGLCYDFAMGVKQNIVRAALCYQQAIHSGHPDTDNRLGELKENNKQIFIPTLDEVFAYYKNDSSNPGVSNAMLGFCCEFGIGVAADVKLAKKHYNTAILYGEISALFALLYLYKSFVEDGKIKVQLLIKFFQSKISEPSSKVVKESLMCLGYLYEYGARDLEPDLFMSRAYYIRAHTLEPFDKELFEKVHSFTPYMESKEVLKKYLKPIFGGGKSGTSLPAPIVELIAEHAATEDKLIEKRPVKPLSFSQVRQLMRP